MEFMTIHDLSRELDVSARVIRYHLTRLIAAEKLKSEEDYRQEDFKDPLHFEWKVNPKSFMRESGLKPKNPLPKIAGEIDSNSLTPVNQVVNKWVTERSQTVNQPAPVVTNALPTVNHSVDQAGEIISLHREMITTLKEQIHVKDDQIRELTKQNRDTSELNLKLNSALLQHGAEIKNLLQLTGGKMENPDVVNDNPDFDNSLDNENIPTDNQSVNGSASEDSESHPLMAA